jgi:hypothetical protein
MLKFGVTAPFLESFNFSIDRQSSIVALIVRLLKIGRPAAIRRLVIPISFDSIDRHAFGSNAHIGEENGEIFPFLADGDAAFAVVFEILVFRISATRSHIFPTAVCSRVLSA